MIRHTSTAGKTANLYFPTPDNVTLGAWFVLNDPFHQELLRQTNDAPKQPSIDIIQEAISRRPTALFLHGASASRAVEWRTKAYLGFTSRLQVNVFAPDYRGFGDSEGVPSEYGLEIDAYASWKWLLQNGAQPEDIIIVGHSLGTGVTGLLAKKLAAEGVKPKGYILLAPFTNPKDLISTFAVLGLPILRPIQAFSAGRSKSSISNTSRRLSDSDVTLRVEFLQDLVSIELDTHSSIQDFNAPTLIAHSHDDADIPYEHSRILFDKVLDSHLPTLLSERDGSISPEDLAAVTKARNERNVAKDALVRKTDIANFGTVEEFSGNNAPKFVYVECFWGRHIDVGMQEGVQDEIGRLFDLL